MRPSLRIRLTALRPIPPRDASLARIAGLLAQLPDPHIDPAFAARLEARLLAEPPELSEPARVIVLPRRRFVVRKTVAGFAAAAALSALPVAAAGSALPASPLYGLKLRIERIELALTSGPVARGFREIGFAQVRLSEVEQLARIGATGPIPATLALLDRELADGTRLILETTKDPQTLARLARALSDTSGGLRTLLTLAPPAVRPAILEVIASGRVLSQQVAAALGVVPTPSVPAGSSVSAPPNTAVNAPSVETQDLVRTAPAGTAASTGSTQNPGETTTNDPVEAPCAAAVYTGPGSSTVHGGVCPVLGSGTESRPSSPGESQPQSAPSSQQAPSQTEPSTTSQPQQQPSSQEPSTQQQQPASQPQQPPASQPQQSTPSESQPSADASAQGNSAEHRNDGTTSPGNRTTKNDDNNGQSKKAAG